MADLKKYFSYLAYPTVLSLFLVNLIPIFGVLFFGWDIFTILILYWLESTVVGFFNVLKMQHIKDIGLTKKNRQSKTDKISEPTKIFFIVFFIIHYSMFMFGHLFFIVTFFKPDLPKTTYTDVAFITVFSYLKTLFISLSFLFLSHAISYIYNFIKKQEYLKTTINKQMFAPYKRIVTMHLTIIFGGFFATALGFGMSAVIILVFLKIVMDFSAHITEHKGLILK
ncbi:hypothetical protein KKH39_00900 [Patescibacteria group bacterium]|nr:hypothetical protein [Patescibacteria group bacterium]